MKISGKILFYLLWPLIWFYAPLFVRVRAVIVVDKEVLVVKNWFGPGRWILPGGGIKFGETPIGAIIRELKEELNIVTQASSIKQITKGPLIIKDYGLLFRLILVSVDLKAKPETTHSKALTGYSWIPKNSSILPTEVRNAINL